jgi:hypothetical protein
VFFSAASPDTYTVRVNLEEGCSTDVINVVVADAIVISNATFDSNTTLVVSTLITVTE